MSRPARTGYRKGRCHGRLALVAVAVLALAACADEAAVEVRPRLLVLGLDGFDPEVVDRLVGEGKMPTFARLAREGASGLLESAPPLLSPILWTTIATGRPAGEHGVTAFTVTGVDGRELPVTRRERRTAALWNIWSDAGLRVGVVGWWATWPAEAVRGTVVSDRAGYHFLATGGMEDQSALPGVTYPPVAIEELDDLLRSPDDLAYEDIVSFARVGREEFATPFTFGDELSHLKWAVATARGYRDVGLRLWRRERPDALCVYFESADTVSHLFGHLYRRADLAGELRSQQERYGGTVEAMYRYLDAVVGDFLAEIDETTTLAVISDHGFELGELPADPSKTRDLRRVSHESHRLHGILYLFGRGVRPGVRIEGAGILDLAPTFLALTGLPASAEMPGRVLADALVGIPAFERVASYEGGPGTLAAEADRDAAVDDAMLEKLRSLGYLDADGGGDAKLRRNEAALALREGRFAEAARSFHALAQEAPEDPSLQTALATALLGLGRIPEALAAADRALEIGPDYAPGLYARGRVIEAQGDVEGAVDAYREAVSYQADHQGALAALQRLGRSAAGRVAETPEEQEAATLLAAAKAAMERGDYPNALAAVERAQALFPDEAIVYQYRSNVCYLMGDRACAIEALEAGLRLDPDNALFAANLRRLRKASPPAPGSR